MGLNFKVIQLADLNEIFEYEQAKLSSTVADPDERAMHVWQARWRQEALEHYLPLGWSFLARDPDIESPTSKEGLLVGYFIAQPFLFMESYTQCLWIEHLSYSSLQARDELCDLAYRLSREKHFQRVLFPNVAGVANSVSNLKPEVWQPNVLSTRTSK